MSEVDNTVQVRVFISRNDVRMVPTPLGMRINCRDSFYDASPGEPALPCRYIRVALPEGHEAVSVSAKILRVIDLTDRYTHVRPMPYSVVTETPDGRSQSETRMMPPAASSYRAVYGADHQSAVELISTEGNGVAPAAVVAVRVTGVTKEGLLELYSDVELTVSYKKIEGFASADSAMRTYRLRTVIEDVVNPEHIDLRLFESKKYGSASPGSSSASATPHIPSGLKPKLSIPKHVDYLIITDNTTWDAVCIQPGNSVDTSAAKMLDAFDELATHKQQRGYRVHVARVSHIVNGYYGDFKTGARDLPEILRNFLKDFCPGHGVEWVLLGGDIDIIPVRHAVITGGPWQLPFGTVTNDVSDDNYGHVEYRDDYLAMRVNRAYLGVIPPLFTPADGPPVDRHELTMLRSGHRINYEETSAPGGTNLRWFHTTDSSFSKVSPVPTEWIRVEGPQGIINSEAMWYVFANRIPTDLYYSSLHGPAYSIPGKHDWDLSGNEIYGQWSDSENIDGVNYETSIGLGRAPVSNADDATVFCRKVIEYELAPGRPSEQQRFRAFTYAAEHVDRNYRNITSFALGMQFDNDYYFAYHNHGFSTIHAKVLATGVIDSIIAHIDEDNWQAIPFDIKAGPNRRGWYYSHGLMDTTPSIIDNPIYEIYGISIPIPTEYVVVFSNNASEREPMSFVLDGNELDPAIADTHELLEQVYDDFPLIDNRLCLYTDEPDLPWTAGTGVPATVRHLTMESLRDALQKGPHFVSLNGHGNPAGCCHVNANFISHLVNGPKTYVVWAVSCDTARMEDPNSMAKLIVKKAGGGAVAYVGFTRSSIGYPGPKCRLAFFDRLRTTRHLAQLHDARLKMWHIDWVHRFDILSCTLYGDPEMPVYRDYRDAEPLFIGNRRSLELHEDRCPWARLITKKIHFTSIQEGLANGYDGCGFCLREHHTR